MDADVNRQLANGVNSGTSNLNVLMYTYTKIFTHHTIADKREQEKETLTMSSTYSGN